MISKETREDFMQSIYDMFSDDGNNDRANQIIDIFDIVTENCIDLPRKVGETIYRMIFCYDRNSRPAKAIPSHYLKEPVVGIHICDSRLRVNALSNRKYRDYIIIKCNNTNQLYHIPINKIGKTVFLTKEQAEKALEEQNVNR